MPNWTENDLTITGENIEKVLEFIAGENGILDFDKIIPYPDPYRSMDKEIVDFLERNLPENKEKMKVYQEKWNTSQDGYNSGGYDWRIANWDTKWNASDPIENWKNSDSVQITFNTAWSPPRNVIKVLSEKFPEYKFQIKYYEQGSGFCGTTTYVNGEIVNESHRDNYCGNRGG